MEKNVKFKKIFFGFAFAIMYFFIIGNVSATTLKIEDVSKQFDKTPQIKELAEMGLNITSKVNTADRTLDVYDDDEKVFSFTYGQDYIEYDNLDFVVTEENYMDDFFDWFWIEGVIESVFTLSGYPNKSLLEDENYTNTYDKYGFELHLESYNFNDSQEDDDTNEVTGSWSASGEYLKYFKISLDTNKIDALITKYGVDVPQEEDNYVWTNFNEYFSEHFEDDTNLNIFKETYGVESFEFKDTDEMLKINATVEDKTYETIYRYKDGIVTYSKVGDREIDDYYNSLLIDYLSNRYDYNSNKLYQYIYNNDNLTIEKDGIEYTLEGLYTEEEMDQIIKEWEDYYNSLTEAEKEYFQGVGFSNELIFTELIVDLGNGLKTYDESLIPYYFVFEGENQKYVKGTSKSLKVEIEADFNLFDSVYVDGKKVDRSNYIASEGSTIITLKQEYLDNLKEGEHELKVTFTDGEFATTNFAIEKAVENPKTGIVIKYGILVLVTLIAGVSYLLMRKKSKFPKHN